MRSKPELALRRQSVRRAGFSLIEILLAIVALVFGLVGVLNLLHVSVRNNKIAADRATAINLAKMKAVEFEAAGFRAVVQALDNQKTANFPAEKTPFLENSRFNHQTAFDIKSDSRIEYRVTVFWESGEQAGEGEAPTPPKTIEYFGIINQTEGAQ